MDSELCLQISEEGADAERLAALTGYLRAELLQLDVEDVTTSQTGEAPPGARVVGVAAVGALLVALGQSADGLRAVVSAISAWLRRGEGTRRTVRLELDGDALELSQASAADQERLIELFVSKHATGEGGPWPASGKR
jgi:ferric-dicitrate binding protein FerR (iron transport regulator)